MKRIAEYTAGGEETFLASRLIQDGVIRNLEVIGEATKNLSSELRDANSGALHDYLKVNLARVWRTVERDLPPLQAVLCQLLGQ